MNNDWTTCKIGDICKKICSGGTPKSNEPSYYGGNIPWLNTKEINFNRIYNTEKYITSSGFDNSSAKWIDANSVIVALYGATAAKVSINTIPLTTNQACCNLTIDETVADYRFVYYYLRRNYQHLALLANGGAQQNLNAQQIKDFNIILPQLPIQHKIANILWTIDDKIELNRRINDNLEEQAKALFKSWFVDSDRNEWVHYELGDITLITAGGDRPSKYTNKKTIECYVPIYSNGIDNEGLYGYTDVAKIHEESITISARGTIGYVCLRLEPYVPIVRLISIIPNKKELSAKYLYLWALTQNITGTGTTQQQLTVPIFRKTPISIPSDTKLKQFNSIADPLFSQIESNKKENIKLSTLRDTLLPKLMSGELSVEEVSLD